MNNWNNEIKSKGRGNTHATENSSAGAEYDNHLIDTPLLRVFIVLVASPRRLLSQFSRKKYQISFESKQFQLKKNLDECASGHVVFLG